jgi:hypothetical protein
MVLDRIRTLFGKEGKKSVREVPFEELPAYIERQEESIRGNLEKEIIARRPQIVRAVENIGEILDAFSEIERKSSSHPKLDKIAQSSLPHFIRSLQQHVHRPLPDGAEEFYHEVSILLKGSLNTMKGAGKYLPMVFPEEMKALRHEIGIIGRTLNEMTVLFSRVREKRRDLLSVRTAWNSVLSLMTEQKERKNRIESLRAQEPLLKEERERIRQSLEGMEKSAEYRAMQEQQMHLAHLKEEVMNLKLQKEQTLGVVLSVYRRAARIARHENNREKERLLEESIDFLESFPRDCDRIAGSLRATLATLLDLIQSGSLPLKGQDEQRIFSSTEGVADEAFRACEEIRSADRSVEVVQAQIQEMPIRSVLVHLKAEEGRLSHAYEKILQELTEEEGSLAGLPTRIEMLQQELQRLVPIVFEEGCSLVFVRLDEPEGS